MNKNEIAFKRGLIICPTNFGKNTELVNQVVANLMEYGYTLDTAAYEELSECDSTYIVEWHKDIINYLTQMLGSDKFKPLKYQDFNTQLNSMMSRYYSEEHLKFYENTEEDFYYTFEYSKMEEIKYGTEGDFLKIFQDLTQVNTALTTKDFETVEWFIKDYKSWKMPSNIPFKENLCMIAALGVDVPIKTSTDVLRIAAYLSFGDSTLILPPRRIKESAWSNTMVTNPEYKKVHFKLTEAQKRYIIELLEKVANPSEMKERYKRWGKLAHHIHLTRFAEEFPKAVSALRLMNSGNPEFKSLKTFNGEVEGGITIEAKLAVLSKRPGMLARRLNEFILRYPLRLNSTLRAFRKTGSKISNKVLFELYTYFQGRLKLNESREVFTPGARKATPLPTLPVLSEEVVNEISDIIFTILLTKFEKKESLGKVYLDERLKDIPLPTNMRSLSDSLAVIVRGTRMPLTVEKKVIRLYLYWTAGIDLDLSCSFIGEDGEHAYCSYSRVSPHSSIQHSGDIIPRQEGEYAEYIDVDITTPFRYGLMTVNNYEGGTLDDKGAKAGIVTRDSKESGLTWLPKTVENSFILQGSGRVAIAIIDFKTKEYVVVDRDIEGIPISTSGDINAYIMKLVETPKVSVYDLLKMHMDVRGTEVELLEEADTKFLLEDFNTNYTNTVKYMLD